MAFDSNLLFSNAAVVTANGNSTVLDLKKTPAHGVPVEIAVTAVSGTGPTLAAKVQESTDNSTYVDLVTFDQITAVTRAGRIVQSKKRYLRINYTVGGTTPSFTITAGIVSGFQRDMPA